MATVSPVAASVKPILTSTTTSTQVVQAGEAISQGEFVYKGTDGKYYKADNTSTTKATVTGMAMHPVAADDYFIMVKSGLVSLGTALTKGDIFVISSTAGAIEPIADILTGDYLTQVGYGYDGTDLFIDIDVRGITHA